ncbi:testis anion transporter 1 isoform X5 [Rissa tridactyla]|uniref:testis anion transporter 1 isoform X5 n=1 Tax=Rissa tridactyla TaxID=75485 RepID=UPI0023BAC55B|nr:testis anion transporter 1 isoform X5 [Rissa tridactyla]
MQTEEHFQARFERKRSSTLGGALQISRENRQLHCSFSWRRFRKITLKMFPVLNWLFSYRFREWILRDLHAGLSVAMFQIPQDFCFPGLLGVWLTRLPLPNINGFLSAFCCSLAYVVFGTSHHISIGSFSILNVVVTNTLKTPNFTQTLSFNGSLNNLSDTTFMKDYMEALTLTASITFLTGIIQLLLGCFCLGFATTYVPKTLIDAYLTAAALHVIVSQFAFIFDIMLDFHKGPLGIFYNLFHYFLALPKANATSILLFLLSMAALRVSKFIKITYKHCPIAFPMELLLVSASYAARFVKPEQDHTACLLPCCRKLFPSCFCWGEVCFTSQLQYCQQSGANSSRAMQYFQLIFQKLCCQLCYFWNCHSREDRWKNTAAAIGASMMLVIALKLGHFFQVIPHNILAAIVVFNMFPFLEKFLDVPILWRQDKYHFVIWLVTFAAVLCFGLDVGLAIAMGFTFFVITIRSHRMKMVVLGQIPNTNIYRSLCVYRAAREIEGIRIFQCCSSISFANMNHFKTYLLHKMDMKAVPLDESEMRALTSLSDTAVERKDLKCSCVCHPTPPPPRIPYTEKLVKQHHADSESSSSSVNLVHWSKYEGRLSSQIFLVGADDVSPGFNAGLTAAKKEDEGRRACLSSGSAVDNSSVQLDQEEQPVLLSCPVHTIIVDFSMVQFVDLLGSELLRQIIHMFRNVGITVLLAACHSSVMADFEKNDFFDSCVTKEGFFLTLHDAVLAALDKNEKPDELEPTAKEFAEEPVAEQQKERSLLLKKSKSVFSAKNSDNKLLHEEPTGDASSSAQNKEEPSSLQRYDSPPLQSDFQDPGWGKRWKYTNRP